MTVKPSPILSANNKRRATVLSSSLEKNLLTYAAAASAGLIGLARSAHAEVIYTASNIPITQGFAGGATTSLDLNKDGTTDFVFSNFSYFTHGLGAEYLKVLPGQTGDAIVGIQIKSQRNITAAALPAGFEVGPGANFQSNSKGLHRAEIAFGSSQGLDSGGWLTVETAYLGLKFVVNGETHYGWARIKLVGPGAFSSASIYGYAYESVPNQAILTGQSSGTAANQQVGETTPALVRSIDSKDKGLGMLAVGALAPPAQSRRSTE
jgi:hypothetical protein